MHAICSSKTNVSVESLTGREHPWDLSFSKHNQLDWSNIKDRKYLSFQTTLNH